MKISELPEDLRKLALEYQATDQLGIYDKDTDILANAFDWWGSKEGHNFWMELNNAKFIPTEDLKLSEIKVFLIDIEDRFEITHPGSSSDYWYITKEEAKRLIEFLQAQI